jgi:hypothetical protein
MKNIHVLPTDKPSRVYKHLGRELKHTVRYFEQKGLLCINQNIYITSDEKPKAGDWSLYQNKIHKCIEDIVGDEFKKIILTTDQDLIVDGVQAIDDEFLEWFVQNPSCEWVDLDTFSMGDKVLYNVVFPKEEPKQETLEKYHGNTVEYWKQNAEENYLTTPISVLKYITVLEEQAEQLREFKKKGGDKC